MSCSLFSRFFSHEILQIRWLMKNFKKKQYSLQFIFACNDFFSSRLLDGQDFCFHDSDCQHRWSSFNLPGKKQTIAFAKLAQKPNICFFLFYFLFFYFFAFIFNHLWKIFEMIILWIILLWNVNKDRMKTSAVHKIFINGRMWLFAKIKIWVFLFADGKKMYTYN